MESDSKIGKMTETGNLHGGKVQFGPEVFVSCVFHYFREFLLEQDRDKSHKKYQDQDDQYCNSCNFERFFHRHLTIFNDFQRVKITG
jgi:hypothetical protein